jgi:putative oxidoreductase
MVNFYAQVGLGQWLRYFLGVLEVGSAVAVFFPRQAFYEAVVLSVSLVGHIVIHAAVLHHAHASAVYSRHVHTAVILHSHFTLYSRTPPNPLTPVPTVQQVQRLGSMTALSGF